MREKLPSTKQIFLYRLVIANSVIHVREFSRKELEYVIIMHIILIPAHLLTSFLMLMGKASYQASP